MEPDFKALAEAWIANDPRMQELDADRKEALVGRLAEAMSRRRNSQTPDDTEIGLVVNVDRDHFNSGGGLSETAISKLTQMISDRIDHDAKG